MQKPQSHSHRQPILGVTFDLIDYHAAFERIAHWRSTSRKAYVCMTNPHSVLLCHRNSRMRQATAGAALTLPDGAGIVLAASLLGYNNSGRVTGPTLMLKLCDWGRAYGFSHFFYGGTEGVAKRLADRLSRIYPGLQITGTFCPAFRALSAQEDRAIVEHINRCRPDILWVGLGAPKQEIWMAEHLGHIDVTAMIGVGAAFDFHSGNVKWAPAWLRRLGLEWAYRLAQQPRQMWRRNLDSPVFVAKLLRQRLRLAPDRGGSLNHQFPDAPRQLAAPAEHAADYMTMTGPAGARQTNH
jgi:N-acetylglucosaminyldiphosphoundecaprenol N-acetyl-beta-D-mannosaminyltransferase